MGSAGIVAQRCGLLILAAFALIIVLYLLVSTTYKPPYADALDKAPSLDLNGLAGYYSEDLRVFIKFAGYIEHETYLNVKFENLSVAEVQHHLINGSHVINLYTDTYTIRLIVCLPNQIGARSYGEHNNYYVKYIQLFQRVKPRASKAYCYVQRPPIEFGKGEHYCCHEPKPFLCDTYEQENDYRSGSARRVDKPTLHVAALEFEIDGYAEGHEPRVFTKPRRWCKPTVNTTNWAHANDTVIHENSYIWPPALDVMQLREP